jgi:FkbM family methyltransferase
MHSQNKEEQYILEYFGDFVGTFCSIGENDGMTLSNVRALFERGWKGVMIEPDPKPFAKLEALYKGQKGLYPYQYAISNHNGKAVLNTSGALLNTGDTGLVSTFHIAEMERFKRVVKYEPIEVTTYSWRTALNRWKIKQFDFISCDAEGEDLTIMKQIDLTNTKCVCVEWNGVEDLKEQFSKLMPDFKIIYTSGENLIFAR